MAADPSAPRTISIGEKIGDRYEILAFIGAGGMADVYCVRDTLLRPRRTDGSEMLFALKTLRYQFVHVMGSRFITEARTMFELTQMGGDEGIGIVKVYNVGWREGCPYMVQELIVGPSLHKMLLDYRARGKLMPLPNALRVIVQMLEALEVVHAAKKVHRDLKPDNVVMDPRTKRARLLDFGVVHVEGSGQTEVDGGKLGVTINYTPPEWLTRRDPPPAGPHWDIYQVGCVLYELVTGEDSVANLGIILPKDPSKLAHVPEDVRALVLHATHRDYTRRPTAAEMRGAAVTILERLRSEHEMLAATPDNGVVIADAPIPAPVDTAAAASDLLASEPPTLDGTEATGPPQALEETPTAEVPAEDEYLTPPQRARENLDGWRETTDGKIAARKRRKIVTAVVALGMATLVIIGIVFWRNNQHVPLTDEVAIASTPEAEPAPEPPKATTVGTSNGSVETTVEAPPSSTPQANPSAVEKPQESKATTSHQQRPSKPPTTPVINAPSVTPPPETVTTVAVVDTKPKMEHKPLTTAKLGDKLGVLARLVNVPSETTVTATLRYKPAGNDSWRSGKTVTMTREGNTLAGTIEVTEDHVGGLHYYIEVKGVTPALQSTGPLQPHYVNVE